MKKLPIYNGQVKDADDSGIFAMSFVDFPANEQQFIALAAQQRPLSVRLVADRQKQLLTGVVLVPDQLIYRHDARLGEFYLRFSAPEIERIALKMMKTGAAITTTTHQHEEKLSGNYLAELWIVKDSKNDKANALGLGELPAGTLVATYKINDPDYWKSEVLTGRVKGFSLEGIFNLNTVQMKKNVTPAVKTTAKLKKKGAVPAFFRAFAAFLEGDTAAEADDLADVASADETDSGEPFLIYPLAEGGEIMVDSTGFCTLDGEQAPAGQHALADGNTLVVDESGQMVQTQPEAEGEQPAEAEAALSKEKRAAALSRGKAVMQAMAQAKKPAEKKSEVTELKAQIATLLSKVEELGKRPSAAPATPAVDGGGAQAAHPRNTDQIAANLKTQRERMEGKK